MRVRLIRLVLKVVAVVRSAVMFVVPLRLRAVKAAVRTDDGRILLVRHSYGSGQWMMPGGLVRRGEAFAAAAAREVHEELGIDAAGWYVRAEFEARHGLTRQRLGLVEVLVDPGAISPNPEISEFAFVHPGEPPAGTSPATLRRLSEIESGRGHDREW
jgi:8-oxo-dGTP pyrophosphatase MutT (NUDIX family)